MSYKEMLNLLEQKKEEILLLRKNISKLEDECEELHDEVVKDFIKNFSDSEEDIIFMLDKKNMNYNMKNFIKEYLESSCLYSTFDTLNDGQLGIGIKLPFLSEDELKTSFKNLEKIIPLIRPANNNFNETGGKDIYLIEVIIDNFCSRKRSRIYLEIKNKEYRILLCSDGLRVYVDWSKDLYNVLSKGRLMFRSFNKNLFGKTEEM